MILEGLVTTIAPTDGVHLAPMGPRVAFTAAGTLERFVLRPFRTAQTYSNLKTHPEGVLHVSDDVLLLARAALGALDPLPPVVQAAKVRGWVLAEACRWFEFRVVGWDERAERIDLACEVVHTGWLRDFFGFNRAKHAVVEAAILATRTAFLPREHINAEFRRLASLVEKTGGQQEHEAFAFLQSFLRHQDAETRKRRDEREGE
jgi:hypothetical protein